MKRGALAAVIWVVVAVTGTACGGDNAMVQAQEGFADKACACKDMNCIKAVQDEQHAWVAKHGGAAAGDEDTYAKMEAANVRLSECIQQVVSATSGQ